MSSNLNIDITEDPGNGFSQCGSCDAPSFSCWCLDCQEALCEDCVSAHRRVSVTRSHRLLNQPPAGDVSTPPTKFCRLHPSEPLKLFCFTCNQPTCRDCQLMSHMNHRYEFVSEALDRLKKQLEHQVQPVRDQRDTVRRSLRDMETRLQNIVQYETCLKSELQQSFRGFLQHLKKRMEQLIKEIQNVYDSEREGIQRRVEKLKHLQEKQQLVTEAVEKAKSTNDLMALLAYRAQIESQLLDVPVQNLSPPQIMPQMKVVTDTNSLVTILNFGKLEVSWIPFCVFETSNQDPDTRGTTSSSSSSSSSPTTIPPTTTSLKTTCSLQTGTTNDTSSPATVSSLVATFSGHLCPPTYSSAGPCSFSTSSSFSATPPTTACLTPCHRPVPQTGATSSCSSGAPANSASALGQLYGPSSSSPFTVFSSSSVAPSTFTSTCPNPQTTGTNAAVKHLNKHLPSFQTSLQFKLFVPVTSTASISFSTVTPGSTSPAPTCKPLPRTRTTSDTVSLCKPSSHQVHLPTSSSSCSTSFSCSFPSSLTPTCTAPVSIQSSPIVSSYQNLKEFNVPFVTSSTDNSQLFIKPLQALSSWTGNTLSQLQMNLKKVQIKCTQPVSAFPLVQPPDKSGLVTSAGSSSSDSVLKSVPVIPQQSSSPSQSQPAAVLLTTRYQLYSCPLGPPLTVPQPPMLGNIVPGQATAVSGSPVILPVVTAENGISVGPSHTAQPNHKQTSNHQTPINKSSAIPSGPVCSLQDLRSDIRPDSSSLKHEQQIHVVKAVADSACDHSVQQVEARQQEPSENEPTSTVCEEPGPVGSARETTDSDSEEPKSMIGQQDCSLGQWQPRVSLFRLPVPPSRPGHPLPGFRIVHGDSEDEIYLEEMSEDCESHTDDVSDDCGDLSEQPSSPESPVTLQIVFCSACGSSNGSVICLSCGRGYHRDCHVPPVGPDFWSEWVCSLCQDLSDPSDPYSSERPQRPHSPCLSLLDQRRCESLLLYLKVESRSRLPQSHLKLISERLTLHRSPPYPTAADFLSDIWSLLKQTSLSQDDTSNELHKNFHVRLVKTFGSELHSSLLNPPNSGPHQHHQRNTESSLKETRKRLRQFLVLMGTPAAKRTKTDTMR